MPRLIRLQPEWHISKKFDDPRWLELRICKLVEMKSLAPLLRKFAQWLMKQGKSLKIYFVKNIGMRNYPNSQYNPVEYYQGRPYELISPSKRLQIILEVELYGQPKQGYRNAKVYIDGKNVNHLVFNWHEVIFPEVEKLMLEDDTGSFLFIPRAHECVLVRTEDMKYFFLPTKIEVNNAAFVCNLFAYGMLLQVFETKMILTSLDSLLSLDYFFYDNMIVKDARFSNPQEVELDYLSHKGGERLTTSITLEAIYAFQQSRPAYNPVTEDSKRISGILCSPSKRMVIAISRHEQQMRMDGYNYTNVYIDGINIGPTAGWNVTWREDRTMLEDDEGMFFYVPPYQRYPDDRSILIRALDMCYFPLPIGMDYGYSNSIANVFGNGELLEVYENKLVLTSLTLLVSRVFHFKLPDSRIAEALFLGLDKIQIEYYQHTESPPRCRKKTVIPFSDFVKI